MLTIAVAAILAAAPPPERVFPERQARATVRIISAAKLRFAELEKVNPQLFRRTWIRSADGEVERAKLIEFE